MNRYTAVHTLKLAIFTLQVMVEALSDEEQENEQFKLHHTINETLTNTIQDLEKLTNA